MKPIKVKTEIKKNWASDPYVMFSTEKHGDIVELDYPAEGRDDVRVYPLKVNEAEKDHTNHVTFSSLPQGIIGAETACKAWLYGEGYYVEKFVYPTDLESMRKEAFKTNRK